MNSVRHKENCGYDVDIWVVYSLVPSPTPSFSSLLSTVKRGGPGTFPHVSDVKGRKG